LRQQGNNEEEVTKNNGILLFLYYPSMQQYPQLHDLSPKFSHLLRPGNCAWSVSAINIWWFWLIW